MKNSSPPSTQIQRLSVTVEMLQARVRTLEGQIVKDLEERAVLVAQSRQMECLLAQAGNTTTTTIRAPKRSRREKVTNPPPRRIEEDDSVYLYECPHCDETFAFAQALRPPLTADGQVCDQQRWPNNPFVNHLRKVRDHMREMHPDFVDWPPGFALVRGRPSPFSPKPTATREEKIIVLGNRAESSSSSEEDDDPTPRRGTTAQTMNSPSSPDRLQWLNDAAQMWAHRPHDNDEDPQQQDEENNTRDDSPHKNSTLPECPEGSPIVI